MLHLSMQQLLQFILFFIFSKEFLHNSSIFTIIMIRFKKIMKEEYWGWKYHESCLVCFRNSKFLSKTLLILEKYRYLSRIIRVLDQNLDMRKDTNIPFVSSSLPRFFELFNYFLRHIHNMISFSLGVFAMIFLVFFFSFW